MPTATSSATPTASSATFPSSCLGNTPSVTWSAAMYYEDVASGISTTDLVPDAGLAGPVANAAYVPVAPCAAQVPPAATPSTEYVSMTPVRLLDTRPTGTTF